MRMFRNGLLMFVLVLPATNLAWAQGPEGLMNGVSFKPLPAGSVIRVRALDNSDYNLVLQADFESALRSKGYTVSQNASIIFTFETRNEIGSWSTIGRRHILSLESYGGQGGGENAKAKFNVYNSETGGLFNRGRSGTTITTPSRYRLDVTIDDRTNGKRLWQGWSEAKRAASDELKLTRRMVPVIVDGLGRTIRRRTFPLN